MHPKRCRSTRSLNRLTQRFPRGAPECGPRFREAASEQCTAGPWVLWSLWECLYVDAVTAD
jgi:hypothetical protein